MRFYICKGILKNLSDQLGSTGEGKTSPEMQELKEKILGKTGAFNEKQKDAFVFVSQIKDRVVTVGAVIRGEQDVTSLITAYLHDIELECVRTLRIGFWSNSEVSTLWN